MFGINIFALLVLVIPTFSLSEPGDIVGKLAVAYHGVYFTKDDGSPVNAWSGWCPWNCTIPNSENFATKFFPDIREYEKLYPTELPNFENGQPANLFSSWDDSTLDIHFSWIYNNSIEAVTLSRSAWWVSNSRSTKELQDTLFSKMLKFSELYYRKLYITWNLTSWNNLETNFKRDFEHVRSLNFFEARGYAMQNGNPVIAIAGLYSHNPAQVQTIVDYVKAKGFYVIGTVLFDWRTNDQYANFQRVYRSFDMIQPGSELDEYDSNIFCGVDGAKEYQKRMRDDFDFLNENNIDYQVTLFPGYLSKRFYCDRMNGRFYWQQFVNLREVGVKNAIINSFNNFETGSAIAKIAEDASMLPLGKDFKALDIDGLRVSSDFYLRLTAEGNRLVNEQVELRQNHNIPFTHC